MSTRLFIPALGTELILAEDWTFHLHEERRNHKFSAEFGLDYRAWAHPRGEVPPREDKITLPAGTHLKVDRIYIRKGGADMKTFDSVSFFCNTGTTAAKAKKLGLKRGRFWAKLPDVNQMIIEDP